jgi:hypothetical protein
VLLQSEQGFERNSSSENHGRADRNGSRAAFRRCRLAGTQAGSIGNTGPNNFRGPGFANLDLSLVEPIPVTERFRLGLRVELFKAWNNASFNIPNRNCSVPSGFRRVANLVPGTSGNVARVMQMALRVDF